MLHIQSRRYLGNKFKILKFISSVLQSSYGQFHSFCDIFAGTGVVGSHFNTADNEIISNDILYSNYVCLRTFLTWNKPLDQVREKILFLNSISDVKENYFSESFGGYYFSKENAEKIGTIREKIEEIAENEAEKEVLICSLLYATDRVANTVGHYDSYRKRMDSFQNLLLLTPKVNYQFNANNSVFNEDSNCLVQKISPDVLYLDPPYNSRQYSDTYHVLENLALWHKPDVFGVARKMDRSEIKSLYCTKNAPIAFGRLIEEAAVKCIILSYNNTGIKKNQRSNATISDEEILQILEKKGTVKVFERDFRAFTTGKSDSDGNVERIFLCIVR